MKKFSNYCGGAELSYSCLLAERRTKTFIDAVRKTVKKDQLVLEAGSGTGILSIAAAEAGAKKVYAIEQNKLLIPQLKRNIKKLGFVDKIKVIEGSALKVEIPEKVDVIICEMICAGLIDESQVPVLNYLLKFLKKDGSVIPTNAKIMAELAHDNYLYFGYELPYLHFEDARRRAEAMTESKLFARVDFNKINPCSLTNRVTLKAINDGSINVIRISTETELVKGLTLGECEAYCPVLVVPIQEFKIKKEDVKTLDLSYEMGGGMLTIRHKIL
ncbi:hypothetical protein A3K73_06740 [Candidatus Pacearchaeota archaeon RBG_13_36_9]|nr:MAG: hypothetical protein A3K73_06740 [Candidatus Pacearchaeota archaeon RBG_13_36_9]